MLEDGKERQKQQNNGLNVVTQKGHPLYRHLKTPVQQLPQSLDIISEVESAILEICPVRVRRPRTRAEEHKGGSEGRDQSVIDR